MKTWPIILMALACLLGGCRTDPAVVMLERENRMLEDEVYRLRGVIEDYQQGLAPSCGETAEGGPSSTDPAPSVPLPGGPRHSSPRTIGRDEGDRSLSPPRVFVPSDAEPPGTLPKILEGPAGTPAHETNPPKSHPPASGAPNDMAPPFKPGSNTSQSSAYPNSESDDLLIGSNDPRRDWTSSLSASQDWRVPSDASLAAGASPGGKRTRRTDAEGPLPFEDNREASAIQLHGTMTGGYDFDEQPGDEGIQAVLEIRDSRGRSLLAPADVSMALYDPELDGSKEGEAARIGRWDFPADTVAEMFRTDGARKALFLEAPWPDGTLPQHKKLHLFIRYTTRDGRNLQADQPIEIALRGERGVRRRMPKVADGEPNPLPPEEFPSDASKPVATDESSDPLPRAIPSRAARTAFLDDSPRIVRPVWKPVR